VKERAHNRYQLATVAAEAMCFLLEAEYQEGVRDLDAMMRRLKDLSAYSLTHAEIMDQREGVELLALGKFFGMTSDSRFRHNQERLGLLSEETYTYQGKVETIEQEVAARKAKDSGQQRHSDTRLQPRLF
jgi:hypothetical protein